MVVRRGCEDGLQGVSGRFRGQSTPGGSLKLCLETNDLILKTKQLLPLAVSVGSVVRRLRSCRHLRQ
jgi:hypothetical protein